MEDLNKIRRQLDQMEPALEAAQKALGILAKQFEQLVRDTNEWHRMLTEGGPTSPTCAREGCKHLTIWHTRRSGPCQIDGCNCQRILMKARPGKVVEK